MVGLAAGLVGGFILAVMSPVTDGLVSQLIVTLKCGALGLVGALMVALGSGPTARPSAIDRPSRLVQQGMVYTIAAIVAVPLTFVLADQLIGDGLSAGAAGGLVAGLGTWLGSDSQSGPGVGSPPGLRSDSIART